MVYVPFYTANQRIKLNMMPKTVTEVDIERENDANKLKGA